MNCQKEQHLPRQPSKRLMVWKDVEEPLKMTMKARFR
ncbi:hypothetical protein SAMN05880570_4484 [Paenibacillus sp. RU4T]|nr:hypothetical protein SAMN05880555_4482 [Paenibacillus sp. RU4X]SIR70485.1 hypothetical protein SAMN05880570_4484 [Paenibacillus sp. RU4T]